MALAENHRNALRAEAASVIGRANSGGGGSGQSAAAAAATAAAGTEMSERQRHQHQLHSQQQQHQHAHQYSDMLNQVYTSHLNAQLQGGISPCGIAININIDK